MATPPAAFNRNQLFDALVQQESGGRVGAVGQPTQYGTALGATQMLPATAKEMAGKLGLPWQPSMLTGKSEAAKQYQLRLGKAYLDQGFNETGNVRDALHYYHGGPDRKLWGPKTKRYANEVLARLGVK